MRAERELQFVGPQHANGAVIVTVSFETGDRAGADGGERAPTERRGGGLAGLAVVALAVIGFAGWTALTARQDAEAAHAAIGAPQDVQTVRRAGAAQDASDMKVLDAYRLSGGGVADVEGDMAWLAQNKSNPAAVTRLSWTRGRMVVVGPYPTSPFRAGDRRITPAPEPGPPGQHAYVVAPRPSTAAPTVPVLAGREGR